MEAGTDPFWGVIHMTLSFIVCANESISLAVESARLYLYCNTLMQQVSPTRIPTRI